MAANPDGALGRVRRPIVQIAYVVPDARDAARQWFERRGAGPFFLSEHIPVADAVYRGEPTTFDHSSAYGQWGEVMVELVQHYGDAPSVATGWRGLHHVAYFADDLPAETQRMEALGYPLAMTAIARGATRFSFFDAVDELGHFFEVYEPSPRLLDFYAMVAATASGWDGADPVRVMT